MIEPYYKNEMVMLYKGDCLEVMNFLIASGYKFNACITDPPYETTGVKWDRIIPFDKMWSCLDRLVDERGAICLFGAEPFSSKLRMSNSEMFKYDWIWKKNRPVGYVLAKLKPMHIHEIISVFSHGKTANCNDFNMNYYPQGIVSCNKRKKNGNKAGKENTYWRPSQSKIHVQTMTNYPNSVLEFDSVPKAVHPTQKPVALLEYLIRTYSKPDEMILDFTCGSGTTGIACMKSGRKCVLIEREEKYCDISMKRIIAEERRLGL